MVNSEESDQMLHSTAYDLGPHCLLRHVCQIIRANMIIMLPVNYWYIL